MMIADGINKLLKIGGNSDIVKAISDCYEKYKNQPQDHVKNLRGISVEEQCYSIFKHLADNVRYKEDTYGSQWIKSPARLLDDKVGDCKSFAMYCCCCLHCLGVPHKFRFVNFDGGDQFTHVYAVAVDEDNNEIILDAVETDENGKPVYNYARPYARKKDITYYV